MDDADLAPEDRAVLADFLAWMIEEANEHEKSERDYMRYLRKRRAKSREGHRV